jgi:hypothetical protein
MVMSYEKVKNLLSRNFQFSHVKQKAFNKIPSSPIAYWLSENTLVPFEKYPSLSEIAKPRQGLATSDNDRFLKLWHEVSIDKISFNSTSHDEANTSGKKWFPCQKVALSENGLVITIMS